MVIVHLNTTLVPAVKPVTLVVGLDANVMLAPFVGPTMLQLPVPLVGVLPANVNVPLLQLFWLVPADAVVGSALLLRMISSCVLAQGPLVIVHLSVALPPGAMPVTVVVGELVLVIVAVPEIKIHKPVPGVAAFALIVNVLVLHCVMLAGPASAAGAGA